MTKYDLCGRARLVESIFLRSRDSPQAMVETIPGSDLSAATNTH